MANACNASKAAASWALSLHLVLLCIHALLAAASHAGAHHHPACSSLSGMQAAPCLPCPACSVDTGGYSGLSHATQWPCPPKSDLQWRWWLAENLKYLYLLFSNDTVLPLDQYVFSTEAHPYAILTPPAAARIPGRTTGVSQAT
jgi:hypothetical protein